MHLPQPILEHLASIITNDRKPAYFKASFTGEILVWGGHCDHYQINNLKVGNFIGDYLFYLSDWFPFSGATECLTSLRTEAQSIIDVHLVSTEDGVWILLLDTTADTKVQQQRQQRVNELSLIDEKYQTILRQRCLSPSIEGKVFTHILSALQVLSLRVASSGELAVLGEVPQWSEEIFPCFQRKNTQLTAADISPFLENFLVDAEVFWQARSPECLCSGLWTETTPAGQDIHFEAIALFLEANPAPSSLSDRREDQRILVIESSGMLSPERFNWLQKARDAQLSFINERKEHRRKLVNASLYDTLTGLPNQNLFSAQLETAFENSQWNNPKLFGVIVLKIDRFQPLNNSLGTATGDQILVAAARRIRNCLRSHDIPARFSGDEFGILLHKIHNSQDAIEIADRIAHALEQPFIVNGRTTHFTVSQGIALKEYWYNTAQDLVRDARLALQQAQTKGRGQYVLFMRAMHTSAFELWHLENDLRTALKAHSQSQLQLHYQPIVDVKTQRVTGFEALLRWHHPDYGALSPAKFIPIAEDSGLIFEVDQWVLTAACQGIRQWQNRTGEIAQVNINISPRHFVNGNLISMVREATAGTNVSPSALCLEITEHLLLTNTKDAIATLDQLRKLGVSIAIDDFGTGYASLSYLQDLPLDTLKIDGYFIEMMNINNTDIVSTIIQLAHKLGFSVTAERVETLQQYNTLKHLKCDTVQGYLLSRPVAGSEAQNFVNAEIIVAE